MIKLTSKVDASDIEESFKRINKNSEIDLFITKNISSDFGIIPAIIQLIATWHLKSDAGKIILDIKDHTDITEFYDLDFFFVVIVYCWSRRIVDVNDNDLKTVLRAHNSQYHDRMKKQEPGGGQKVSLACFDHLSKKKGLLNAFYIDGEFIDNEIRFGAAIDDSLKRVLSFNKALSKNNFKDVYLDIIEIIYELMKNTDNWAKTDEFNRPLNPSVRGLFLKFHKKKRNTYLAEFNDHEGLWNYFSVGNLDANSQDELYFLELSVYDSGVGFVKRYKGDSSENYTSSQQVQIVKDCLLVNNTSAIGLSKTVKGKGLDRIMRILDNKGLFWLRTGNLSIYRNLRKNRYKEESDSRDIDLYDWFKFSNTNFSNLEYGQGSVITLVYPLSTFRDA